MTKKNQKNSRNTKKNKHEPQTKHSLKSFGFLVFWFSRGFVKILLLKEKTFMKGRVFTTLHNFLKIWNRRQKNTYLNIEKNQQNTANSSKLFERIGLGGGVPYIYIYVNMYSKYVDMYTYSCSPKAWKDLFKTPWPSEVFHIFWVESRSSRISSAKTRAKAITLGNPHWCWLVGGFQPILKNMLVKMEIFPEVRSENRTYLKAPPWALSMFVATCWGIPCWRDTLPETDSSPLKIGRAPKGNDHLPTIHFQGLKCYSGIVWNAVDGSNIRLSRVEVGSSSHHLEGFLHPRWWSPDFFHQQYHGWHQFLVGGFNPFEKY